VFEAATLEAHHKALQGQRIAYRTHWKQRVFNVWVQPLRRLDGSIHGTIGLALDVTEQTLAEATAWGDVTEAVHAPVAAAAKNNEFVLLRKYLEVTHALLTDLAAHLTRPEEQERQQQVKAWTEELQAITHQLDHLPGSASRMRTDAA
jgi:hypothetical protein